MKYLPFASLLLVFVVHLAGLEAWALGLWEPSNHGLYGILTFAWGSASFMAMMIMVG